MAKKIIYVGKNIDFNEIIWISSSADESKDFMERVAESVSESCAVHNFKFTKHSISTAKDLERLLNKIARQCLYTRQSPIIHLDFHGEIEHGLQISSSEMFSWERLIHQLRLINIVTENRLIVFGAACEAMWAIRKIDTKYETPFYLYVAPENKITNGELEGVVPEFYRSILDGNDAMHSLNFASRYSRKDSKLTLFHCERIAILAIAKYIQKFCSGKGKRERIDYLLDMRQPRPNEVAEIRRNIKKFIEPEEKILNNLAKFFHNQTPSFTVADIKDLLADEE